MGTHVYSEKCSNCGDLMYIEDSNYHLHKYCNTCGNFYIEVYEDNYLYSGGGFGCYTYLTESNEECAPLLSQGSLGSSYDEKIEILESICKEVKKNLKDIVSFEITDIINNNWETIVLYDKENNINKINIYLENIKTLVLTPEKVKEKYGIINSYESKSLSEVS
ncbi:MAG: hypothetical protein ACOCRO_07300 [Halanaerobiales bacterium]